MNQKKKIIEEKKNLDLIKHPSIHGTRIGCAKIQFGSVYYDSVDDKNLNVLGNRVIRKEGIIIKIPEHPNANKQGYVFEKVLVVETSLKRRVDMKKEYIKHVDGDKLNVEESNLVIMSRRDRRKELLTGNTWNQGRELTKEHKTKLRDANIKNNNKPPVMKGVANHRWNGGKRNDPRGYIALYAKDHPHADSKGYYWEHRIVVEKFIGRYLTKEEVVHHINEDKSDNRIENLMIFSTQREHMKFHIKIRQFGVTNPIRRQISERWDAYISSKN